MVMVVDWWWQKCAQTKIQYFVAQERWLGEVVVVWFQPILCSSTQGLGFVDSWLWLYLCLYYMMIVVWFGSGVFIFVR